MEWGREAAVGRPYLMGGEWGGPGAGEKMGLPMGRAKMPGAPRKRAMIGGRQRRSPHPCSSIIEQAFAPHLACFVSAPSSRPAPAPAPFAPAPAHHLGVLLGPLPLPLPTPTIPNEMRLLLRRLHLPTFIPGPPSSTSSPQSRPPPSAPATPSFGGKAALPSGKGGRFHCTCCRWVLKPLRLTNDCELRLPLQRMAGAGKCLALSHDHEPHPELHNSPSPRLLVR